MDEPVFADEMERLRLEQLALEQQLANIDANMAYTLPADVVSDDATKKVAHVHVVADVSAAAAAAEPTSSLKMDRRAVMPVNDDAHDVVAAEAAAEPSLRERIADLEKMRAHYSRAAQQSMNAYLRTIHHTDDYANRRATQLQPQPFSFDARERTKSAGIREARRAREQREREAQEQEQQQPFRATPVPPTTFMNKYGIMVEEWKERKSAMEMLAKERADCAKREADFVRLSAEALRHTREDLLGVRHQPTTAQQRRAQSVAEKKKRRAASSPHADDVPMEVQLQLWPSIKEHEQVRKERIKVVAAERRVDINAQFTEMMPLMSSPTPAKIYQHTTGTPFGIGQAITASAPAPTPSPTTTTPAAAAAVVSGVVAVGTTAVSPTTAAGAAATCAPPSNSPTTAVPPPPPTTTAPPAAAPPPPDKKAEREAMYVKHHPQLTFHPNVKPGVPNFQQLWAADKVELIERKQKRPTTTPTPFHLTPSPKDAVRGKKYVRQTASPPPPPQRARSAPKRAVVAKTLSTTSTKLGTDTTTTTTLKKDADATTTTEAPPTTTATTAEAEAATANVGVEATAPTSAKMNSSPHGTRAHALRTEAIFSKYINKVELVDHVAEQDARYLQQVHQRRREVRKRVGKYLANYSADHDRAIAKKVATLKRQMREAEHDARDRLMEMHKRVQSMPPVFAEPVHLAEMSKARAETEKEIVAALRETKLDERTIRAILAAEPPTSATAEADATTTPATTTTTATANGAAEPSATTPAVVDGSPGDVPAADSVGAASPTVPAHTSAPSSAVSSSSSSAYSDSFDASSSDSE